MKSLSNCRNLLALWTFFFCAVQLHGEPEAETPLLELDPGGHKASARGLVFSADGRHLISASDDKTIRIFFTETGELLRTYRGWSGPGFEGAVQSLAISPDDALLAAGGYRTDGGFLRLIDFQTGAVRQTLEGHTSTVIKLAFTPDGRRLVSAQTGTGPLILWKRQGQGFIQERVLDPAARDTYGLALRPDGRLIATAGFDGTFRLWDARGRLLKTFQGVDFNRLAFAPDGRSLLAAGFNRKLTIMNVARLRRTHAKSPPGRVLAEMPQSHYGQKHIEEIAWTPAGIFSAGPFRAFKIAPDRSEYRRPVFRLDPQTGKALGIYVAHTNTVVALTAHGERMASSGDNDHALHIWDAKSARNERIIRGGGQAVFAAAFGADGRSLYFGNTNRNSRANRIGPLTRVFSFDDLEVRKLDAPPTSEAVRLPLESVGETHIRYKSELYNSVIEIGQWRIQLPDENDSIFAYSLTPDGKTAVVGSGGNLISFDVESGDELGRFQGHEGAVMALSISADGKRLLTGSADQTLRLWDIATRELIATFFFTRGGEWIATTPDPFLMGSPNALKYFGWKINAGRDRAARFYGFDQFDLRYNRPDTVLQNIFPDARAGSKDEFLKRTAARIQALRRQRERRAAENGFRPEELDGPLGRLRPPRVAVQNRPPDYSTVTRDRFQFRFKITDPGDAPVVAYRVFVNGVPGPRRSLRNQTSPASSSSSNEQSALPEGRGSVRLSAVGGGRNLIEISALNAKGVESRREAIRLRYRPPAPPRPRLFVAAFGVDEYSGGPFAPLNYAVKDARQFAEVFEQVGRDSYPGGTRVLLKTDAQVTKTSIQELKTFWRESSVDDTVLVYFSGHGLSRPVTKKILGREFADYEYFYATGRSNLHTLQSSAITIEDIRRLFETTPARQKMLFLDSCQSFVDPARLGGADADAPPDSAASGAGGTRGTGDGQVLRLRGGGKLLFSGTRSASGVGRTARLSLEQADTARFFPELRRGTGTIEVSAAINGQAALEGVILSDGSIIENGVFTYSIRRALAEPAARTKEGLLTARSLRAFVLRQVADITTDENGRPQQTPMVARDIAGRDFTLSSAPPVPPERPTGILEESSYYRRQIDCPPDSCLKLSFTDRELKSNLRRAMKAGQRKILIDLKDQTLKFQSKEFAGMLTYMREVAGRGGRVLIDPVAGQTRGPVAGMVPIPLVKDVIAVGLDVFNRVYNYFYYRPTGDYHARAIYDRKSDHVKVLYFSHRAAGDLCAELLARCDVVHYVDDALFDRTLSDRLKLAGAKGGTVRVVFGRQPAKLPAAKLDFDFLRKVQSSARLYKWLLVSGKAEKQPAATKKIVGLKLAVSVLDYSLKLYDLFQDILLYAPARNMRARIYYEGPERGGSIKSVVFEPLGSP